MIEANDLIIGNTYFTLFYYDQDLLMPDINTLVYIGKNINSEDSKPSKDLWYFQDAESYLKYGASTTKPHPSECMLHRLNKESLFSAYGWQGLIEELSDNKQAQNEGRLFD